MADTNDVHDTVSLTTKLGSLSLGGKDALAIFLFIAILGLGGLTIYEHIQRSQEHDTLGCQIKLNLFMQSQDPMKPIDWRHMPQDVFGCVPKFLYDRDSTQRGN